MERSCLPCLIRAPGTWVGKFMAHVASDARSEASGSSSARSGGSRKYRLVSRGSNVDESLFGSSTSKGRKKNSARKIMIGEVSRVHVLPAAVHVARRLQAEVWKWHGACMWCCPSAISGRPLHVLMFAHLSFLVGVVQGALPVCGSTHGSGLAS